MRLARFALLLSLASVPALALTQSTAAPTLAEEPHLVGQASALRPFQPLAQSAPKLSNDFITTASGSSALSSGPALDLPPAEDVAGTAISAAVSKRWGPAISGGLLLLILLFRKLGAGFFPALATGRGAAWLTVTVGTVATVYELFQHGDPTLPVILTAAAAGFWSLAQSTGLTK